MPCHWLLIKNLIRKVTIDNNLDENSLQANQKTFPPTDVRKKDFGRVSSYISFENEKSRKGSLTVEAAFILPLFLMGMLTLICLMDIYRVHAEISLSLNESAKELGMYAYAARNHLEESPIGIIDNVACIAYTGSKIKKQDGVTVNLSKSSYQNHLVSLVAEVTYRIPFSPFPISTVRFRNQVQVHDWTGYSKNGKDADSNQNGEMVYVTDRQTVYHTSEICTHLQLSILETTKDKVSSLRNENGGKYYPCPHCADSSQTKGRVYIARSGDRYHIVSGCQSLNRNVRLVPKTEIYGKSECSRCSQKGGANGD